VSRWRGKRKLYIEDLHDFCSSPNIIHVIKYKRTRWMELVALWGRGEMHTEFWCGRLKERDHLEELEVDGRIILKWILKN
jgi:hypothetical protein